MSVNFLQTKEDTNRWYLTGQSVISAAVIPSINTACYIVL